MPHKEHDRRSSRAHRPSHNPSRLAATLLRPPENTGGPRGPKGGPGHSDHFLERTMRLDGDELDRAMRLYHHSALVRTVVAEQMKDRPEPRAAIVLRDEDPSAHVIITRDGGFVTCLSAAMGVDGAVVLPYDILQDAMDRADAKLEAARRREKQLKRLPAATLSDALAAGPGHVHREMVEIIEIDPQTYLFAVARAFFKSMTWMNTYHELRVKHGWDLERWRKWTRLENTVALCFYLFGAIDTPVVADMLAMYVADDGPNAEDAAAALGRHKGGGLRLLAIGHKAVSLPLRQITYTAALLNGLRYPKQLVALAAEARKAPPIDDPEIAGLFAKLLDIFTTLASRCDAREINQIMESGEVAGLPLLPEVADPTWVLTPEEHREHALRRLPVSAMFPPQAQAAAVKVAWQRALHKRPMPVEPRTIRTPVVRDTPRVGRNDRCPCNSGSKYKHCCERNSTQKQDAAALPILMEQDGQAPDGQAEAAESTEEAGPLDFATALGNLLASSPLT